MKKLLALALLGSSLTLTAFGQGEVQFKNFISGVVDARITQDVTTPGSPVNIDGSDPLFRAALLGGAVGGTAATMNDAGSLALLSSPDGTSTYVGFRTAGAAGILNIGNEAARVVPGVNWGGSAMVQVVAWYGNETDYAAAVAANDPRGVSNTLTLTLPSSATDPNLANLVGLQSFNVTGSAIIPEPTTFALAGLGAAALLIFRRRK
jgi:PEP-CTERM motif